jgi:hypothetical protein
MKVLTLDELKTLNKVKVNTAVNGKKGLQIPLEECAKHIAKHGDWTVAQTIIDQWNDKDLEANLSHEAAAGVKWFVKYCGLKVGDEGFEGFQGAQFVKDNLQEGRKNPYYKGITIAKPFVFDLDEEIQKLVSKANNAMKKQKTEEAKGKEAKVVVDVEHLRSLKSIVSQAA